jgi:hypothetical protein
LRRRAVFEQDIRHCQGSGTSSRAGILSRSGQGIAATTRDGFDPKHPFTQFLLEKLQEHLGPIYHKEEEKQNKSERDELSAEAKQRINDALRQLNKYLSALMGTGGGGNNGEDPAHDVPIQFVPSYVKLVVGQTRTVTLLLRSTDAKAKGTIMVDSSDPKVEVTPNLIEIEKGIKYKDFLSFRFFLKVRLSPRVCSHHGLGRR